MLSQAVLSGALLWHELQTALEPGLEPWWLRQKPKFKACLGYRASSKLVVAT